MKKHIIYTVVALFGIMATSCNSDLLEIRQKGVVDENSYYSTDEDAFAAITVVYATWKGTWYNDFFIKNLISDDACCGGGGRGDNANYEQMNEYRFAPNNTTISGPYSQYYQIIYYSNVLLSKFSVGQSAAIDRCIAEAKTARAWAHTQLTMLWGTPPIVDHVFEGSSEYQQPNSTPAEMWAFIINDLSEATAVLPSKKSMEDRTATRLTKEAALAFMGKAQVMSGDYSGARTTLKKVIDSGLYGLVDGATLEKLFSSSDNEWSREAIFESNTIYSAANVWANYSLFHLMLGWRSTDLKGMPSQTYSVGWGFFNPKEDFVQAFLKHEGNSARFNAYVKDWETAVEMGAGGLAKTYLYGCVGYLDWKWHSDPKDVPADGYGFVYNGNPRWMRYAEVLLLYAEACAQTGDDGSGLAALNAIQNRAGAPTTGLSMENVKTEKRFEMWLEGTRFIDLVRWGDVKSSSLPDQGAYIPLFKGFNSDGSYNIDRTTYKNASYGFQTGRSELLPFPEAEIISNQKLTQNPGWGGVVLEDAK